MIVIIQRFISNFVTVPVIDRPNDPVKRTIQQLIVETGQQLVALLASTSLCLPFNHVFYMVKLIVDHICLFFNKNQTAKQQQQKQQDSIAALNNVLNLFIMNLNKFQLCNSFNFIDVHRENLLSKIGDKQLDNSSQAFPRLWQ